MAVLSPFCALSNKTDVILAMPLSLPLFIASENSEYFAFFSYNVVSEMPSTLAIWLNVSPCADNDSARLQITSFIIILGLPTCFFFLSDIYIFMRLYTYSPIMRHCHLYTQISCFFTCTQWL